ncbi:hypothetical protein [Pantoea sp. Cy-640]|jgi:hypothetical protein|uniref:hypothetical protein n=1 Tax=Pantoea sp. Cy-640 TaxID=2608353 RepID=UPI001419AF0C|nr:hypothetical protein [Pantoea sp. Cy-640]
MPDGGEFASGSHKSMIAAKKMAGKEKGAAAPEGVKFSFYARLRLERRHVSGTATWW